MMNLAPHLVNPLPLLVPAFDGKRPDRLMGVGLNMYDVMARERAARARTTTSGAPTATARSAPRRRSSCCPRSPPATRPSAYLFYDCQTDDVRLVLTVLGEAERFGAVLPTARGDRA